MAQMNTEDMPLPALFEQARQIHSTAADSTVDQDKMKKACDILRQCDAMIDQLGLFSPNECKEDISTTDLKYLLVPYYLGELTEKIHNSNRLQIIKTSQAHLKEFVSICEKLELVPKEEVDAFPHDGRDTPEARRAKKIARFKRQKAAESKLQDIKERKERRSRSMQAAAITSVMEHGDEPMLDDDGEEEREAWLTTISLALCKALDLLDGLKKEEELVSTMMANNLQSGKEDAVRAMLDERTRKAEEWHKVAARKSHRYQHNPPSAEMPLDLDDVAIGAKHDPSVALPPDEKHKGPAANHETALPMVYEGKPTKQNHLFNHDTSEDELGEYPTEEELHTLRRVADKIPWMVYTIAFVELCERFSYYGTTVVFTNFIQQPLPTGSKTGAGFGGQSGALNMGQQASTGIGTFNQFWVYLIPLFGAYVADTYLGRYKTICYALAIAIVGHIILVMSAIPPVIVHQKNSFASFIIGLIIMGVGTGTFKPNISPMIAEQLKITKMTCKDLPSGERVIVDPTVTQSRVYHYFYLFINIGALVGQVGMVYAEKYVGFYLAYLLPTILLCVCPAVVWYCRDKYVRSAPEGSVLGKAVGLFLMANKGRWSINPVKTYHNFHDGTFWEKVKPSAIAPERRPKWMTFDDQWVDEVARGFSACSVFCWVPLYWLTYNQLNNNLTSQAAVMKLNGLPNDVLSNLDPFALIILIPICDIFIYPFLRKMKINFSPIKKITAGFYTGAAAMIWAAVIQAYIYKYSECGHNAAGTKPDPAGGDPIQCTPVDINVWAQTGAYVLIAISEILASITTLEYAFSKAPKNMRSLVMAFNLFMSAISAALGEAFVSLSTDPLLVWNYGAMAVLSFVGGTCFWFQYRKLDHDDDRLNMLPTGHLITSKDVEEPEARRQDSMPESHEIKEKM